MKISKKLFLGFAIVVILSLAVGGMGIAGMNLLNESALSMHEQQVVGLENLGHARNYISQSISELRTVTFMSFYNDMFGAIRAREAFEISAASFERYLSAAITIEELNVLYIPIVDEFRSYFLPDSRNIIELSISNIPDQTRMLDINALMARNMEIASRLEGLLDALTRAHSTIAAQTVHYNQVQQNIFMFMQVGALIVTIMLGLGMAFFITRSITKPVNEIVDVLNHVSNGNFNVNIRSNLPKDEIGELTRHVVNFVDIVRKLIDDINKLSHEFITIGDVEYRIDERKYNGAFKELVQEANGIVSGEINDVLPVIHVINQIASGDFDVTIHDMPGKKAVLPQAIRTVAATLNELYESVSELAKKSAQGDFKAHIDETKFSGKWAVLANELNSLMDAMAEPLADIERNVIIMSHGDFSHLDGEYHGTFGVLQKACNVVNDTTAALIKEISESLQKIANGNLTVTLKESYIGAYAPIETSIITILDNLNSTLAEVKSTVDQVSLGAEQISTSAMFLADGTAKQTASIMELSNSVNLIHDIAMKASNDATTASESSERIQEYIATGGSAVKSMEATMNKVKGSSEEIGKIIDVINNISFQTNLLALNASVEAARAGEHGRGFSVVADEVRSLASRSQQSTSDTSQIIEEDLNHVNEGLRTTKEVVESFGTITENVQGITRHITEIAKISGEQLVSISNINASVSEITEVIMDISAKAEESASASQELSSQAELLREKIAFFELRS